MTTVRLHQRDLPEPWEGVNRVAIDTETTGLSLLRDRLCVVQLSRGDGTADLVQIERHQTSAPNLEKLLRDTSVTKLFHYGRFDMAMLFRTFRVMAQPVFCTKIASRLARTYTDRHSLKDLTREFLGIELSKQQQSSDWGAPALSEAQRAYAASDVLHLHALQDALATLLKREERHALAEACFAFLPSRVLLDLAGWPDEDVFAHS